MCRNLFYDANVRSLPIRESERVFDQFLKGDMRVTSLVCYNGARRQ